ncbi:MAG: radical SAM protein [Candidatus Heimdallarchaeota archaeon]|nr:radical SAM protein [Candidatus Heimdallarchaeota archaeon]
MKARYESFGGILRLEDPPVTIYVNQEYMKELGYPTSNLWSKKSNHLSAPLDVHFALTNECPMECKHCYKSSTAGEKANLSLEEIKEVINVLTEMHVFSVAFGGGEPFARKEIFDIAEYTRSKGIIPNVTTNGFYITKENAERCKVFGHMHVSLDLHTEEFDNFKNKGAFTAATKAIDLLVEQGIHVGINCVLSSKNFEHLEDFAKFCLSKNVKDISFLRFKPIGRANKQYSEMKLTNEQNIELFPKLMKLMRKYKIVAQVDCSMLPMFAYHKPSYKLLDFFGAQGCVGGDIFIEIKETGEIRSCSFSNTYEGNAKELKENWEKLPQLTRYRDVTNQIEKPCSTCKYLDICRGGCHVISEFLSGDFNKPDPECPIVIKYNKKINKKLSVL